MMSEVWHHNEIRSPTQNSVITRGQTVFSVKQACLSGVLHKKHGDLKKLLRDYETVGAHNTEQVEQKNAVLHYRKSRETHGKVASKERNFRSYRQACKRMLESQEMLERVNHARLNTKTKKSVIKMVKEDRL